jgi:hypothetical protein
MDGPPLGGGHFLFGDAMKAFFMPSMAETNKK